jgi:hypothetical protein
MKTFKDFIHEGIRLKVAPHVAFQRKVSRLSDKAAQGDEGASREMQAFMADRRDKQREKARKDQLAAKKRHDQLNKPKKM